MYLRSARRTRVIATFRYIRTYVWMVIRLQRLPSRRFLAQNTLPTQSLKARHLRICVYRSRRVERNKNDKFERGKFRSRERFANNFFCFSTNSTLRRIRSLELCTMREARLVFNENEFCRIISPWNFSLITFASCVTVFLIYSSLSLSSLKSRLSPSSSSSSFSSTPPLGSFFFLSHAILSRDKTCDGR